MTRDQYNTQGRLSAGRMSGWPRSSASRAACRFAMRPAKSRSRKPSAKLLRRLVRDRLTVSAKRFEELVSELQPETSLSMERDLVTIYDELGRIIAQMDYPKGKLPKFSRLFKQFPEAARIHVEGV